LNYELLRKFAHSLDRSDFWQYHFKIKGGTLTIKYEKHGQSGTLELCKIPEYQTELLTGLPTIDLKE